MWGRVSACIVVVLSVVAPGLAGVCPDSCVCSNVDGLHKATCSSVAQLYKFTLRQRHHNINVLDLSHNNITEIKHELDRLTEVVVLDLSTNGITKVNKFLQNAKKLVHLNLANNRIETLSLSRLPSSVSSLDLTNNLLKDVPNDLDHLKGLEHLELEGNPLNCSCENLIVRDNLLNSNVFIDSAKCAYPPKLKGKSWLELKKKKLCTARKTHMNYIDVMLEDQPIDAVKVGEDTEALKSIHFSSPIVLNDVKFVHGESIAEDDDSVFLRVQRSVHSSRHDFEGSGEFESTTYSDEYRKISSNNKAMYSADKGFEDTTEGSGMEDYGSGFIDFKNEEEISTTPFAGELWTGPPSILITDTDSDYPSPPTVTVYPGARNWYNEPDTTEATIAPVVSTSSETAVTQATRDTTVSEHIRVTQASEINEQLSTKNETPQKTGTYVCIAIIVVILVGLIGFAIVKGQIRRRRDRRMIRQQKKDVEQASKELVDMNKTLLGKPAMVDVPLEKKMNGKYELVPTHEKKVDNNELGNGVKNKDSNGTRTGSPTDTNQNKSSSKDNNIVENPDQNLQQETSFESTQPSLDSRKDTHSLSSEDIFVPINEDDTRMNGNTEPNAMEPLLNGNQSIDTDFLSPREYVPVYSPDMGRVRIKLTETPKPKTPVLVTRSRSNAGDMIITPVDGTIPNSST